MALAEWRKDETVAIITMTGGENRHNLNYANEMMKILDEILADKTVTALVLTSSDEKNFCQGVDVQWLMERFAAKDTQSIKDFMYRMNDVFRTLLLYPMPVIAAINGHAFGNGAILSCACDFRFMRSDRGFFCFPEVDLGIPFLPGMIAWVRKAIPQHAFHEWKYSGRRVTAAELEKNHVIQKACANQEELMKETLAFAKTFVKKRGIFGEMKKRMHKQIVDIMANEDGEFVEKLFLFVQD
jgi:enoyl-CoA hydratase/carnithine racemase